VSSEMDEWRVKVSSSFQKVIGTSAPSRRMFMTASEFGMMQRHRLNSRENGLWANAKNGSEQPLKAMSPAMANSSQPSQ
jgi:hypothetical protein